MATRNIDANGHDVRSTLSPSLTAGAVGTTAAGTIAGTTNAGAAPTVTAVNADDNGGCFTLNPVTGGGAQTAGEVAVVTFSTLMAAAPRSVVATIVDVTASPIVAQTCQVTSITAAGFKITTPALTTAHNYQVCYRVYP